MPAFSTSFAGSGTTSLFAPRSGEVYGIAPSSLTQTDTCPPGNVCIPNLTNLPVRLPVTTSKKFYRYSANVTPSWEPLVAVFISWPAAAGWVLNGLNTFTESRLKTDWTWKKNQAKFSLQNLFSPWILTANRLKVNWIHYSVHFQTVNFQSTIFRDCIWPEFF